MFKNITIALDGRTYDVSLSIHPKNKCVVAIYIRDGRVVWEKSSGRAPGPKARAIIALAEKTL